MLTPDNLVSREVHYCVSYLVSTLANALGAVSIDHGGADPLMGVIEQAFELSTPLDDWEEAARQAGWSEDAWGHWVENGNEDQDSYASAQECCEGLSLEPYQWEVFEHWIVSDWLADKLATKGEKVDKDFAGMIVWARTTSGQGIASDSVIEAICVELNAA